MGITGFIEEVLNVGLQHHRPRGTRHARRALGVVAALGLCTAGSAVPASAATAADGTRSPAAGSGVGLSGTSECTFGGKNIKSTPWSLQRVLLDQLWSEATGKGTTVAVIDTGVDKSNPQLTKAMSSGGKDFVGSTDGTEDVNGHGTRVAGIIAARKMAGTGFSGIAPQAGIVPLRYTGAEGKQGDSTTMSQAIKHAVDQDVDIINISSDTAKKEPNAALEAAVAKAVNAGILVVAASGNDGANGKSEKTYPASYDGVLAVGASDRNNERAFFSQAGDFVDVAAPGVGMVSTVPKGGQCAADGTSFSAPYVAGVAALLKDKYPDWTSQEIASRIAQTATRPGAGPDNNIGWGVVDPVAALSGDAKPQSKPVPDNHTQGGGGRVVPMAVTIGETEEERTQRISLYVVGAGTLMTLLIGGAALTARDNRRKRETAAVAGPTAMHPNSSRGTTTSTRSTSTRSTTH